jgi:DNA-binding CsgD family transcriptional regulator
MAPSESNLTTREKQVLDLIVAGKTSKEIGVQLGISHRTVEVHRELVKAKMNVRRTIDLVRKALTKPRRQSRR